MRGEIFRFSLGTSFHILLMLFHLTFTPFLSPVHSVLSFTQGSDFKI